MALVPEDRKREGLILPFSVESNITMASLEDLTHMGIVDSSKEADIGKRQIEALAIKTPTPETKVVTLSGGNQQKCIVGRWMERNPKILILDEPTRGIDVGTKTEIQKLVIRLAEEGMAVVFISSEIEEMLRTCERMVVMRDGSKVGELSGEEMNQSAIMSTIAGGQ